MSTNQQMFLTGKVTNVDPKRGTCEVQLTATGNILYNVPVLNTMGGSMSTDSVSMHAMYDANVLMIRIHNQPYILATIPTIERSYSDISVSATNTRTSAEDEATYGSTASQNMLTYSGNRMVGVLPGDKILAADGDAELFLGAEGLAILKASPLAQLILGGIKDFARLVARDFELYTDFGHMKFTEGGPEGRTSMIIEGGATFCDESSPYSPKYTVKIYAGDVPGDPSARLAINVTNAEQTEYVRIALDDGGNINLETSKDRVSRIGMDDHTTVAHDDFHYVVGDQTIVIGNDPEAEDEAAADFESLQDPEDEDHPVLEPSGFRTTTVYKDDTLTVKQNAITAVTLDKTTTVGKSNSLTVGVDNSRTVVGSDSTLVGVKKSTTVGVTEDHTVGGLFSLDAGLINITAGGLTFNFKAGGIGTGDCSFKVKSLDISKA